MVTMDELPIADWLRELQATRWDLLVGTEYLRSSDEVLLR